MGELHGQMETQKGRLERIDKRVLCIVPARANSKRVKGKNIRTMNGKPLILWTLEEAKKAVFIDKLVVSTDDKTVVHICKKLDIELIDRPAKLADDNVSMYDVIMHLIDVLKSDGLEFDCIMLLQPTSPLRTVMHIEEAARMFFDKYESVDSLISVTKNDHSPWWLRTIDGNGLIGEFLEYDKENYNKAQDFPDLYRINGAIYIVKVNEFIKHKGFETDRTLPFIMNPEDSVDIDTEMDFMFAEFIMKYRR